MKQRERFMSEKKVKEFRILVGYDGSNTSKEAIRIGKKYARAFGGKLHVVTCLQSEDASLEEIKRFEDDLEGVRAELDEMGFLNETHLLVRDETPGEGLVKFATDNGVDQIIIGVKRRSRVGKLVFGSICRYVILESPCPVVTVK